MILDRNDIDLRTPANLYELRIGTTRLRISILRESKGFQIFQILPEKLLAGRRLKIVVNDAANELRRRRCELDFVFRFRNTCMKDCRRISELLLHHQRQLQLRHFESTHTNPIHQPGK